MSIGGDLRQRGLLDRQERSDLIAARADDADQRRGTDQPRQRSRGQNCPGEYDQQGADEQHPPTTEAVRRGRDPEGEDHISEQGQAEQQPDGGLAVSEADQIEDESDGEKPVSKEANGASQKEQEKISPSVPFRQSASRLLQSFGGVSKVWECLHQGACGGTSSEGQSPAARLRSMADTVTQPVSGTGRLNAPSGRPWRTISWA